MISDELKHKLRDAGLNDYQLKNKYVDIVCDTFMKMSDRELTEEAIRQVNELAKVTDALRDQYRNIRGKVNEGLGQIKAIMDAENKHGECTDDEAKNLVSLYAQLVSIGENTCDNGDKAVECASYVAYAYIMGKNNSLKGMDEQKGAEE